MARKPKPRPSFFKILTHDYTRRLKLPPYFVRKHRDTLPKNAKVRTSSGKTWDVKIEKTNDGNHCFTGGWSKFVNDLGLEFGEFIILWFDYGKSEFNVSVFGTHGCEKEIFHCKSEPDDVELSQDRKIVIQESLSNKEFVENEAEETEIRAKSDKSPPRFEIILKEHKKSRLTICKEFAEKAGLIGKRAVVLKYLEKKPHWPVLLEQHRNGGFGGFRFKLTTGWIEFRKANGLVSGKTYSFVFNGVENVIQVEPVHKK